MLRFTRHPLTRFKINDLTLDDGTSGASASASTAANALVLVNFVDVAFRDCSHGALVDAGAASDANVSDFVSHFLSFFGLIMICKNTIKKGFRSDFFYFFPKKIINILTSIDFRY